jgi:hypothetical protein
VRAHTQGFRRKLVVVGATGSIGLSTVDALVKLNGNYDDIFVGVREPDSEPAAPL